MKVANAGLENVPEGVTDVPFDQVEMPELGAAAEAEITEGKRRCYHAGA